MYFSPEQLKNIIHIYGIIIWAEVRVQAWISYYPPPDFSSDWFSLSSEQGVNSYTEVQHELGAIPEFVQVQVRADDVIHWKL